MYMLGAFDQKKGQFLVYFPNLVDLSIVPTVNIFAIMVFGDNYNFYISYVKVFSVGHNQQP